MLIQLLKRRYRIDRQRPAITGLTAGAVAPSQQGKTRRLFFSRRQWLQGVVAMGGTITVGLLRDRQSMALAAKSTDQVLQPFQFVTVQLDRQGEIKHRVERSGQQLLENLGNGEQLAMVAIPAGEFLMGAAAQEEGTRAAERPQHPVQVSAFYLGKYPITQEQWQAVMGHNPAHFAGKNLPVERVTWDNAMKFCAQLSTLTGKAYRLPTEAEWEYACRAGTTTPFYYGTTISTAVANYQGNFVYGAGKQGKHRGQTTAVDKFPANAFGLYDMHGNVWEWCADRWSEDYSAAQGDGSAWNKGDSEFKVLRGGSWVGHPQYFRSACRYGDGFDPDLALNSIGLRVCLDTLNLG